MPFTALPGLEVSPLIPRRVGDEAFGVLGLLLQASWVQKCNLGDTISTSCTEQTVLSPSTP